MAKSLTTTYNFMALRINKQLTTKQGLSVPSGSYVWIKLSMGEDDEYKVTARLKFFISKEAKDEGRSQFNPIEIPDTKQSYEMKLVPSALGSLSYLAAHNFIRDDMNVTLGGNFVEIVE